MNAVEHRSHDGQISSIDSFVVGLAPSFWAHVPLLIEHVKRHLHLLDGIQCFILKVEQDEEVDFHTNSLFSSQLFLSSFPDNQKIIPVSKCHLIGTIVNAERKSNGCSMYILDDGTGMIDILHYSDGDLYSLPSLSGHHDSCLRYNLFEPGDIVRIFGRIQCKVLTRSSEVTTVAVDGNKTKQFIPASSITREIHASLIVPLEIVSMNRSRARPNSIDHECEHWINCVKFLRTGLVGGGNTSSISSVSNLQALNNANDVLPFLGSDIANQILERNSVSSSLLMDDSTDDVTQAWRLFGTQCQCTNTALKRDLLYCHCAATRQDNPSVDPNLVYRDALLTKLLEEEATFASGLPPPKSINDIWKNIINEVEVDQNCYHFQFQYSSIAADEKLNQIALEELTKTSSMNHTISRDSGNGSTMNQSNQLMLRNVQELTRSTVRALRKDGIFYLIDANTDTYLLMSRTGVLEPYLRTKFALQKLSVERRTQYGEASSLFPYIKSVPRSRLEFVRRCLLAVVANKCD